MPERCAFSLDSCRVRELHTSRQPTLPPGFHHHLTPHPRPSRTAHPCSKPWGYSSQQVGPLVSTSGICFCLVFNNVGDESVFLKGKDFQTHGKDASQHADRGNCEAVERAEVLPSTSQQQVRLGLCLSEPQPPHPGQMAWCEDETRPRVRQTRPSTGTGPRQAFSIIAIIILCLVPRTFPFWILWLLTPLILSLGRFS